MTEKRKMSIQQGLSEIKLYDKKINKIISEFKPFFISENKKYPSGYESLEDWSKKQKSTLQSLYDLMEHRQKIRAAIIAKNVETKVKIGNTEMTISEALEQKTIIALKKELLLSIKKIKDQTDNTFETKYTRLESRFDEFINANKDSSEKSTKDTDNYKRAKESFLSVNSLELIDPLKYSEFISKLSDEIDEFEKNVDYALSTVNIKTEIEV